MHAYSTNYSAGSLHFIDNNYYSFLIIILYGMQYNNIAI